MWCRVDRARADVSEEVQLLQYLDGATSQETAFFNRPDVSPCSCQTLHFMQILIKQHKKSAEIPTGKI
jgi:hypothetical protein